MKTLSKRTEIKSKTYHYIEDTKQNILCEHGERHRSIFYNSSLRFICHHHILNIFPKH